MSINGEAALAQGLDAWPDRDRHDHGTIPHDKATQMGAEIIVCSLWLALARAANGSTGVDDEQRLTMLTEVTRAFHDTNLLGADTPTVSRETHTNSNDSEVYAALNAPRGGRTFQRLPHGTPPTVSEHGHHTPLAQLVDPYQIDVFPGQRENTHRKTWFNADVLAQAVTQIAGTWKTKITGKPLA